jgi:hypothetical protein
MMIPQSSSAQPSVCTNYVTLAPSKNPQSLNRMSKEFKTDSLQNPPPSFL